MNHHSKLGVTDDWGMDGGDSGEGGTGGGGPGAADDEELTKEEQALLPSLIGKDVIKTGYENVASLDEVQEKLHEHITLPILEPELFRAGVLAEGTRGVLLFGPPGTGKTLLARALASEAGASFLHITQSVIKSKWYGEAEKNANAVFTLARKRSPCIIFIDEVDALMSDRGDTSAHNNNVLNEMMQEWDGLIQDDKVVVLGATNRPYSLDEAVLRRFPRRLLVDLPSEEGRVAILTLQLKDNVLESSVDLEEVSRRAPGFSGSDLKELAKDAALEAVRQYRKLSKEDRPEITPTENGAVLVPISMNDFNVALRTIKKSVDSNSNSAHKLNEWNAKFGEIKAKAVKHMGFNP